MMQSSQPAGLAFVLNWCDGGSAFDRDKLVFAALATSAAVSPLATITYRSKGASVLGRAATVAAAAPLVACVLQPTSFADSAVAPTVIADDTSKQSSQTLPELKSIISLYYPVNIAKMLVKNLSIQLLIKFNGYMAEYLEHEQAAITAEAQGRAPPPAPQVPDFMPALEKGFATFGRELAIASIRRVYEHIAAWRLSPKQAQALLRDSKAWIRDVLSIKHATSSRGRRFLAYYFATMHSTALFYAADCTFSIGFHTFRTWKLKRHSPKPVVYWLKGVALQVVRCSTILVTVSIGASLGSMVKPGTGTQVGQLTTEIGMSVLMNIVVESLLE